MIFGPKSWKINFIILQKPDFWDKRQKFFRKLKNFLLDFHPFEANSSASINIREDINQTLEKFGLSEDILTMIPTTTDHHAPLIASLSGVERLNDILHAMNILARRLTNPYKKGYLPKEFAIDQATCGMLLILDRIVHNVKLLVNDVK